MTDRPEWTAEWTEMTTQAKPGQRVLRRQYGAFAELVHTLAQGESHQLGRLIDDQNPLRKLNVDGLVARLSEYGALTKLGETITGNAKRARKLLGNEPDFCHVLGCDDGHADQMALLQGVVGSGVVPTEEVAAAFPKMYALLGERALIARLGISKTSVLRYRSHGLLSPEARRAMIEHGLGISYAYAIWKNAETNDVASELAFIDLIVSSGASPRAAERSDMSARELQAEPDHDLGLFGPDPDEAAETEQPKLLVLMEANLKISMALLEVFQRAEKKVDFLVQELGYQEKK